MSGCWFCNVRLSKMNLAQKYTKTINLKFDFIAYNSCAYNIIKSGSP